MDLLGFLYRYKNTCIQLINNYLLSLWHMWDIVLKPVYGIQQ